MLGWYLPQGWAGAVTAGEFGWYLSPGWAGGVRAGWCLGSTYLWGGWVL